MKTTLTEKQWNDFVKNHCTDNEMKKISYQELMKNTNNGQIDFKKLTLPSAAEINAAQVSGNCETAIGYVVVDVVCLALGAVSLRSSIGADAVEDIAGIVGPDVPEILTYVDTIANEASSDLDRAKAVWGIIKVTLKSPYDIVKAVYSSLPWYKRALAIAQGVATIVAALATDGAALIAEIVVELASFGYLAADSATAISACSTTHAKLSAAN